MELNPDAFCPGGKKCYGFSPGRYWNTAWNMPQLCPSLPSTARPISHAGPVPTVDENAVLKRGSAERTVLLGSVAPWHTEVSEQLNRKR